jgi:hypothetical protein
VVNEVGAAGERDAAVAVSPGFATSSVPVVSLWPSLLILSDTPSGEEYRWAHGGVTVHVRPEDVEYLRGHNHGGETGCCGGGARVYFQFPNDGG